MTIQTDIEFHIGDLLKSRDMDSQSLSNGLFQVDIHFISSLCDIAIIRSCISEPLAKSLTPEDFANKLDSTPSCMHLDDLEQMTSKLLKGEVLIRLKNRFWALSAPNTINNTPEKTEVETAMLGPTLALTENHLTSINLIRQRYPAPELLVMEKSVGQISKTKLSIMYDKKLRLSLC
jgi:spore germination protein KA